MLRFPLYLAVLSFLLSITGSKVQAADAITSAEAAYRIESFGAAFDHLSNLVGLLEIAPIFDQVVGEERAKVLFDLARCRVALGDSTGADIILDELFRNDPDQNKGSMDVPGDAALAHVLSQIKTLRRMHIQAKINSTSASKAAIRSLVLPGWGQRYRGRRTRGNLISAAAGVFALGWAVTDRSYRSAVNDYHRTSELDLNLAGRTGSPDDPTPFADRFAKVESRASSARTMGIALLSLWVYSVSENFLIRPGQIALTIALD